MKKIILLSILASYTSLFAQPAVEWQKSLGGSGVEDASNIQLTTDGGYIVTGYNSSNDGDVSGNHGGKDVWVVKLDSSGALEWQKSLGGTGDDQGLSVQQTADGGYAVAGYTESNDGDASGNQGGKDVWLVKLTALGVVSWQKSLGGTGQEWATSIQQTTDGGYAIAGYSNSNDGAVTGNHGNYDFWVVKLTDVGSIEWQKCFGGTNNEYAYSIQQSTDGGYAVVGYTNSNDGDVSNNHGKEDIWLVKLSGSGTLEWQKCLGGTGVEWYPSIQKTSDGGYIINGKTNSTDGDVTVSHGSWDFWVVKLNSLGVIEWQKSFGGTDIDWAESIQQTTDGGYIVAGSTLSNNGDVSGNHGGRYDFWVIKITTTGILEWQKCIGGTGSEYANSIQQTPDGLYVVAGYSTSIDGDASANNGLGDFWVVKLGNTLRTHQVATDTSISIYPNPTANEIHITIDTSLLGSPYTLYDTSGKVVVSGTLNSEYSTINTSKFSKGVYIFSLGDSFKSRMIIKE